MKLRIVSDIHLEFEGYTIDKAPDDKETILILAGDIGVGTTDPECFILGCLTQFKHVVYVLGNHEFYHHEVEKVREFWKDHGLANLTVLDDTEAFIDGVRFIGGTLWTDFNKNDWFTKQRAKSCMPDFRCVKYEKVRMLTDNTVTMHNITKNFIMNKLMDGYDGKTVVVTHHMPHNVCVHEKYKGDSLNGAFVTDLNDLFEYDMDLWVHGHTHEIVDEVVNNTRIVCNPLGYPGHEKGRNDFDPLMTVEI